MTNFFNKIYKIHFLLFVSMTGVLLAGCSGPAALFMTRSEDEIWEMRNSRFVRARVDFIASDENEESCHNRYSDKEWQNMHPDMSREDALKYRSIAGKWNASPATGFLGYVSAYAPKSMNIEKGDIVDIYAGEIDVVALRELRYRKTCHFYYSEKFELSTSILHSSSAPQIQTPVVLGIVCKHDEEGCQHDISPETQLGIGRLMSGPGDYRGVEAESQQPIFIADMPWKVWLSINE